MSHETELRNVLQELVEAMLIQAKEMERLITHVEQHTTRLSHDTQMARVVSELSLLRQRVKRWPDFEPARE